MTEETWKEPRTRRRKAERVRQQQDQETPSDCQPLEIRSGAIIPQPVVLGNEILYTIQANTNQGLRTFKGMRELRGQPSAKVKPGAKSNLFWWPSIWLSEFAAFSTLSVEDTDDEKAELNPHDVLAALAFSGLADSKRRELILLAETIRFDSVQISELEPILRRYINSRLLSEDRAEQVAVASAIRKLVAMLPATALPLCADLLKPETKTPVPLEMEVVKMIARKLTAALPEDTAILLPIGEHLIDLVWTYLNPRTLSKRFFGATVLESCMSLALMRNPRLPVVLELLRTLRVNWFRATVARQARVTAIDIGRRFPGERSAEVLSCLAELKAAAEFVQP